MGKKTSAAAQRRKKAQAEQRAARVAHAHRGDSGAVRRYWHGGHPNLKPGTVLVGLGVATALDEARNAFTNQISKIEPGLTNPDRVYFSTDIEFARAFAARRQIRETRTGVVIQRGTLYEVEPIGQIELDPDFGHTDVSWCAPKAKILRVVDANVTLDAYAATQRVGPYTTWYDGSPNYSATGQYLLSPEQRAAGQPHALEVSRMPWTPIEHVNAAILGKHSGDRPSAKDCDGVALGAPEGNIVFAKHVARFTQLQGEGIEIHADRDRVPPELNELIAPAHLNEQDDRAVAMAVHPEHGLIGAVVISGVEMHQHQVMSLERLVVTPMWQRRGIGSVLALAVQQLMPKGVNLAVGHCRPEIGPFFAQIGFTVLRPGVPMIFPNAQGTDDIEGVELKGGSEVWFYRQGRI